GDPLVEVEPAGQPVVVGEPGRGGVVDVADGDQATGPADAGHLAERGDRVGEVLQHLVGVHDVERGVGQVEGVGVADGELHRRALAVGQRAGLVQRVGAHVQAEHPAGGHAAGEVDGDRARPAADVEHVEPGAQVRRQVAGGV